MPRINYGDLNDWSNRQGNRFGELIKRAKSGACDLYRRFPGFMTGTEFITTPGGALSRGVWDNLCGDDPGGLPNLPPQPFEGGQCPCVVYDVTVTYDLIDGTTRRQTQSLYGEIGEVVVEYEPNNNIGEPDESGPGRVGIRCRGDLFVSAECFDTFVSNYIFGFVAKRSIDTFTIVSVVRKDGNPDDCGNPPRGWNPNDRLIPSPDDLMDEIQDDPDNGNDFGITIPVVYAPINNDLQINVDVGGITIGFDLGGVTFSPEISPSGDITNNPPGDPVPNNPSDPKLDDLGDKLDELSDKIDDIEPNCPDSPVFDPPLNPDDYDQEEKTEEDPKKEDGKEGLSYVLITLSKLPIERKQQAGEGSPDVVYAGWFEWLIDGLPLPRQPIHFQQSLFAAPRKVTGYAYTLTNGAKGSAKIYTRKPQ